MFCDPQERIQSWSPWYQFESQSLNIINELRFCIYKGDSAVHKQKFLQNSRTTRKRWCDVIRMTAISNQTQILPIPKKPHLKFIIWLFSQKQQIYTRPQRPSTRFVAFEIASIHIGISSSLSHLNLHVSPPNEFIVTPSEEGSPSNTTRRHSNVDSRHLVAIAFSRGISANNDIWDDWLGFSCVAHYKLVWKTYKFVPGIVYLNRIRQDISVQAAFPMSNLHELSSFEQQHEQNLPSLISLQDPQIYFVA